MSTHKHNVFEIDRNRREKTTKNGTAASVNNVLKSNPIEKKSTKSSTTPSCSRPIPAQNIIYFITFVLKTFSYFLIEGQNNLNHFSSCTMSIVSGKYILERQITRYGQRLVKIINNVICEKRSVFFHGGPDLMLEKKQAQQRAAAHRTWHNSHRRIQYQGPYFPT